MNPAASGPQGSSSSTASAISSGRPIIRLGRGNDPVIYPDGQEIQIGKAIVAREGTAPLDVASGSSAAEVRGGDDRYMRRDDELASRRS